jgi:hypothetical protein
MDGQQYQAGSASLFVTAARTPDFCLALLMSTSDGKAAEVIAIKHGERGYYKTDYGRQTQQWVDEINSRMGIDLATAEAYSICSVFGNWDNFEVVRKDLREAIEKKVASHVN